MVLICIYNSIGRQSFDLRRSGVAQIDAELRATFFGQTIRESETSEILTAHAGIAYESTDYEAGLTFGWRF